MTTGWGFRTMQPCQEMQERGNSWVEVRRERRYAKRAKSKEQSREEKIAFCNSLVRRRTHHCRGLVPYQCNTLVFPSL